MFERFTERARQVVNLAQDEARGLAHNYIGTEHLLLGLLDEEEGIAAKVLNDLDITPERVREALIAIVGKGDKANEGQIPFTPRGKKILELSLREALSLGHNYIGTEHILLGLIRENEGVATRILDDMGLDAEKIRNEVIRKLSGAKPERSPYEREERTKDAEYLTGLLENDSWATIHQKVGEWLRLRDPKPADADLLAGYRAALDLTGKKVKATQKSGVSYTAILEFISATDLVLVEDGAKICIKLDTLDTLIPV